ncbi:MAG TPA: CoA-transferase [Methylomirabilota bacterium]
MSASKILAAAEAAALIKDGSVVGVEGAGRLLLSEAISSAVERRFLESGRPRGIILVQPCGFGDDGDAGASHFAHEGLVKRVISPGWGDSPRMAGLALANKVEAYCFPQGVVCQMVWAAASRKPRVVSHVGLDTFVDPRQTGGRLNAVTTEELVERVELDGTDWLSFRVVPIDVAIIRGTTADEFGNMSMEQEPAILEPLALAQAARANGGLVLAEVKRVVPRGSLNPQLVRVPGILVDGIVVNPDAWQIHGLERHNPAVSGEMRVPRGRPSAVSLDERMLVARRAAMELRPGAVINIGFGISDGVPVVAAQEGLLDDITITIEQGTIGGLPMRGRALAAQTNVEAIVDQISQFNFYQGGGLDLAFLSFAEADAAGNVNVSKFGSRLPGCGGFIDISQNAKRVVFCGLFGKAGDVRIVDGRIHVVERGRVTKFRGAVEHVTFSGARARAVGKPVLYVTERAVFGLGPRGVELREIAPGCDLEKDVLAGMEFRPAIASDLRTMEARVFEPRRLGLRERWAVGGGARPGPAPR